MHDAPSPRLTGRCACGAVRFAMNGPPIIVHGCHCLGCQRRTGSAFAVNALIERDRITLTGEAAPETVRTPSALPGGKPIHRCPRCRLAVWSGHALLGEAVVLVPVGVLDKARHIAPDVHCFTATKHPWVVLPSDKPAFEGDYDPETVWSARALARLRTATGR